MAIKKGEIEKIDIVVGIIGIIVGLIVIVLHVTGIFEEAPDFWGIYLIILALLVVVFIIISRFAGKEIEKIVGPLSKCAIFLLIVMVFVDYLSKLPPTQEIIIIIGWWSVVMAGLIGIILTWEQRRGTADKASGEGTSHNHDTKHPENISNS